MIVSEARRQANRRNAARSTGPRTPEGKERSRANALKHGLCASVIVPEDASEVHRRTADFSRALQPQDPYQCWLVAEIGLLTIRIERAGRVERQARDKAALRAALTWEDDRRLEAARLGESLGKRPEVVVEQLGRTPQGCEWLMTRWAMLAHSADVNKAWTADQRGLAFDLLGTPAEFRQGHEPGASLDLDGRPVEPADDPAAVARREIAALRARRELVSDLDEAERALAEADLSDDAGPELRRLRRHESSLQARLRWCLAQLRHPTSAGEPRAGLTAPWPGQQEPSPPPVRPPAKVEAPAPPKAAETKPTPARPVVAREPVAPFESFGSFDELDFAMIPVARPEARRARRQLRS